MSMTKDSTTTGPPSTSTRSSCFHGCFGCSSKKTRLKNEDNSGSRWRRWSLFKKSPKKTVPVDLNTATMTSDTSWEIQVVEENATKSDKHVMVVEENRALVTSGEQKSSRKKWSTVVNRQKETKPAATSVVGPGLVSPEPKTVTVTSHLKSLPLPKQQKYLYASPLGSGANSRVLHRTPLSGGEFDSVIGMSIILVILVILVLWGKLCAILCTSAWFFIVRRLVAVRKRSSVDKRPSESYKNLNLESEEYKKMVILEGLLQRNHRKVVGRCRHDSSSR